MLSAVDKTDGDEKESLAYVEYHSLDLLHPCCQRSAPARNVWTRRDCGEGILTVERLAGAQPHGQPRKLPATRRSAGTFTGSRRHRHASTPRHRRSKRQEVEIGQPSHHLGTPTLGAGEREIYPACILQIPSHPGYVRVCLCIWHVHNVRNRGWVY